jgi:hypothetical protein
VVARLLGDGLIPYEMKAYRRPVVSPRRVPSAVCQLDAVNKLLIAQITQQQATALMSALGQKRTCAVHAAMSAMGQ